MGASALRFRRCAGGVGVAAGVDAGVAADALVGVILALPQKHLWALPRAEFNLNMRLKPLSSGFFHACEQNFHEAGCVQMPLLDTASELRNSELIRILLYFLP